MLCQSYNAVHQDSKSNRNPHFAKFGKEFRGPKLPFGAKVYYRPSAAAASSEQQKISPATRVAIFVGYRMQTGGIWSGQILVLDAGEFRAKRDDQFRCATEHPVSASEVYSPGSAADDSETKLSWPVAAGRWTEQNPGGAPIARPDALTIEDEEVVMSSQRQPMTESIPDELLVDFSVDPSEALQSSGGDDSEKNLFGKLEQLSTSPIITDHDRWEIQGDYMVRIYLLPRTTLFSPGDVPDDPPPLAFENINVQRTTNAVFSGQNSLA
jgi:hypothetical protein